VVHACLNGHTARHVYDDFGGREAIHSRYSAYGHLPPPMMGRPAATV